MPGLGSAMCRRASDFGYGGYHPIVVGGDHPDGRRARVMVASAGGGCPVAGIGDRAVAVGPRYANCGAEIGGGVAAACSVTEVFSNRSIAVMAQIRSQLIPNAVELGVQSKCLE